MQGVAYSHPASILVRKKICSLTFRSVFNKNVDEDFARVRGDRNFYPEPLL